VVQIDREIDPVACRRYFKLAIVANIGPIVAEEHLDHVPVPEAYARSIVFGWDEQVQDDVVAAKQEIDIAVGPESPYLSLRFRITNLPARVFVHGKQRSFLPNVKLRIEGEFGMSRSMPDRKRRHWRQSHAWLLCLHYERNYETQGG